MKHIIVTTHEELSEMIELSIARRIKPLQEIINKTLNPQKKNVTVKETIYSPRFTFRTLIFSLHQSNTSKNFIQNNSIHKL